MTLTLKPPVRLFQEKNRFLWFLLFALLFSIQVLPRVWQDSALPDEAWETTTGYYYWLMGDVSRAFNQPPLAGALQAFPLLFLHLTVDPRLTPYTEDRAYSFFYVTNRDQLDLIIALPRLVTLIFAIGTGWLLYRLVRREGPPTFFFTLLLWTFEPTLLTHSVIAKTDSSLAFFCFAALLLFLKGQKEFLPKWDILAGVFSGMAVTCKLSGLSLGPLFLLLDLREAWKRPDFRPHLASRWLRGISAFLSWVFLIYFPATLKRPGHRWPFTYFHLEVEEYSWYGQHSGGAFATFFLGKWLPNEPLWHFPVIFILKSAIPFVLLLAAGIFAFRKLKAGPWIWIFPWGWIALLGFSPTLFLRYALPAYPALILTAAKGAGWLWHKGKNRPWRMLKPLVILLGAWNILSVAAHFPDQISYFNDLIRPGEKSKLLSSCYYDLDQDLKRLGITAREHCWEHVKLAYMGQDDPYYYGLPFWEPWTQRDMQGPQPGTTYVVQAGFLRERNPEDEKKFSLMDCWIARTPPTGTVCDTWSYFETPGTWKGPDHSPVLPSTPFLVYQNAPYRHAGAHP